jgi:hypothetical protein
MQAITNTGSERRVTHLVSVLESIFIARLGRGLGQSRAHVPQPIGRPPHGGRTAPGPHRAAGPVNLPCLGRVGNADPDQLSCFVLAARPTKAADAAWNANDPDEPMVRQGRVLRD